jgi:uncharacterized phage protein (TIGR01671 family)
MNREIKFRIAYRSPHTDEPNVWMISEPITPHQMMFDPDTQVDFTDGGYLRYHEMDDGESEIIFEQYTGLRDREDVRIFEGDIVREEVEYEGREPCSPTIPGEETGRIGWDGERFAWAIFKKDEDFNGRKERKESLPFWGGKLEVIGNIHQNPELLAK